MRILVLAAAVLLAACQSDDPPPPPEAQDGRAETQSIRNTQAIGYDGKAIADKVDDTLNKNDERVRQVEQQSGEQPVDEQQQ
jgi:hypothetical protein